MKKKKVIKVLSIALLIAVVLGVFVYSMPNVLADVGNNNRYTESSSSTEYTTDGDGEDLFFVVYLFDLLFRVIGPIPALIIAIVIVVIIVLLKKKGILPTKRKSDVIFEEMIEDKLSSNNTEQISSEIKNIDANFSEEAFLGWVKEVFIKIQQAWTNRDWKVVRPFESNELFSQHKSQLQEYIDNNKINKIEKININYCELKSFRIDGDKEVLEVDLRAIMRDYVVDATTNAVLESDPNKDWHMRYILTFVRKSGVKTKAGSSNKSTTNCPNCGAPTDITSAGQCNYCDSVITTGEHDWVLSDIRSIK